MQGKQAVGGDVVCRALITLPVYPEPEKTLLSGKGGVSLASSSSTVPISLSTKDLNTTGKTGRGR